MGLTEAKTVAAKWRRLSKEIVIDIPAQAAIILDDRITELEGQRDKLLKACKAMVELWDTEHPDDPCACMPEALDDLLSPLPCELCTARDAIKQSIVDGLQQQ